MVEPRPVILLVEDEPEIRRFLCAALDVEGYRSVESTTGRRGTIDAATHKRDLAIVDHETVSEKRIELGSRPKRPHLHKLRPCE